MVALRDPRRPLSRAWWAEKYEPLDRAAAFADSVRDRPEPLGALAGLARAMLAGGFVVARAHPGPGGQAGRGTELGHVHTDLGDDRLGRAPVHPGDGVKQLHLGLER